MVIVDVMSISAGFVLSVLAGVELSDAYPFSWLLICTILLVLFLGFSERRNELVVLKKEANTHKKVLAHYSPYFLDQMIGVVTASTVISYMLYTISEETVQFFGTRNLILTVPFVLYGIFRYLYLVHRMEEGGNPTTLLFSDKPLLINILLWILSCIVITYI